MPLLAGSPSSAQGAGLGVGIPTFFWEARLLALVTEGQVTLPSAVWLLMENRFLGVYTGLGLRIMWLMWFWSSSRRPADTFLCHWPITANFTQHLGSESWTWLEAQRSGKWYKAVTLQNSTKGSQFSVRGQNLGAAPTACGPHPARPKWVITGDHLSSGVFLVGII